MPEYIFKHSPNQKQSVPSFLSGFSFEMARSEYPRIRFDSDRPIYRDISGNEVKKKFAVMT